MSRFSPSPLHLSLIGVLLSGAIFFNEELANHRYALAHQGQGLCGLPAIAALFAGLALSFVSSLGAGIWAYFRYKRERTGKWKLRFLTVALGPIWFCALAFLIIKSFEVVRQWSY